MSGLLGPADVRALADRLGVRPTKTWGQNFVVDANTVRRIVAEAGIETTDHVVEIGPGLGSLTLALLERAGRVTAVEIDPALAAALPATVAERMPGAAGRLDVVAGDAMTVSELPGGAPTALVANLPYNVSVPVLLHFLAVFPTLARGLVMVQAEVADRLAAAPGSRVYGVPSAKAAWYAEVRRAGSVPRSVFWPVPRVDSALVSFARRPSPVLAAGAGGGEGAERLRRDTFDVIDAAFAQRRKTLRAALSGWAGGSARAEQLLRDAGIDPRLRGESLDVAAFARIAAAVGRSVGGTGARQ